MNEVTYRGSGLEYLSEGKTISLPLEDGTMYSKRKGVTPFSAHPLEGYIPIVGEEKIEKLEEMVQKLKGAKFLDLNSAAVGGGVAEMLYSSVPFLNQLGIEDDWKVIRGNKPYYESTKTIHNLMQGREGYFTSEMMETYFSTVKENVDASLIDYEPDVVFVHDTQPLGLSPYLKRGGKWIWRCHNDIDEESLDRRPVLWDFIGFWMEYYDSAIFSTAHNVITKWPLRKFIIPPFIDPLSDKNRELGQEEINPVLEKYGIDPKLPIIAQIGRFDPWKGLDRTIDTYRIVKEKHPCQLVIAGGSASDDPEGEKIYNDICEKVKGDANAHVLNLPPTSHLEINAIQRASKVIMQPSTKEGFGLVVTEAMWKEKPVIGGRAGGIQLQIREGEYGYLWDNLEKSVEKVTYLLENPEAAKFMGRMGKRYVRDHFLLPDRITDYLRVAYLVLGGEPLPQEITSFHSWDKLSKREMG